jgi:hypothetical protein
MRSSHCLASFAVGIKGGVRCVYLKVSATQAGKWIIVGYLARYGSQWNGLLLHDL